MRIPGADKAVEHLITWSLRDEWAPLHEQVFAEHLDFVHEEFGVGQEEIIDALGAEAFGMLAACVLEDFFTARFGDDGDNVIDDYLKRRGWREKVPARRYLEALRDSIMSLYEVVDLDPGRHLVVKDLVRGGEPVTVAEKLGSETAARWDRIAARLVNVNGRDCFTGAMLLMPRHVADDFLASYAETTKEVRKKLRAEARDDPELEPPDDETLREIFLAACPMLVTQAWLADALERISRGLPEVRNADGDEIMFAEVRFPVPGDESAVRRRLDAASELDAGDEDGQTWTWLAAPDAARKGGPNGQADGLSRQSVWDDGGTILGHVRLADGRLVLTANSAQRAERGEALLTALLGDLVGRPVSVLQSLEQALDERGGRPAPEPDIPAEEAAQIIGEFLDKHYRETLDSPVGVLDGKTPRQAVRGKKGRVQVADWLKYLENGEARRAARKGARPYDFLWMWRELGILDLRR